MPLTPSNPKAVHLARSLAALTGEIVEQAVERALRDQLAREQDARLSYREFEEMLGEREVELDRTTFYL
jgi:hypothetical protein